MSTPRPTEADVEAAESAVCVCEHSTADHAWYGCAACGCRRSAIQALLASDWVDARDAEHEAEVENLVNNWRTHEERGNIQRARAEAAERDRDEARRELADLRAKVAALHGGTHWCFDANEDEVVFQPDTQWWPCPTYALLPTGDDQ